MIKLDSILLDEILNTPGCDLDVSSSVWGHLSGLISGYVGLDPTKENMKLSVSVARILLAVGYIWGRKSTLAEIESMGKNK